MVEKDIDILLSQRFVPKVHNHLAEQIIGAAAARESKPTRAGLGQWLGAFIDGFALPQPALALAAFLVLGLFLGMRLDAAALVPQAENLVAYLEIDDGEWS